METRYDENLGTGEMLFVKKYQIFCYIISPGGQLPLKGGHHARLKKHVKRVVFHGRAMYARTVERVSKLPKFGKRVYFSTASIRV